MAVGGGSAGAFALPPATAGGMLYRGGRRRGVARPRRPPLPAAVRQQRRRPPSCGTKKPRGDGTRGGGDVNGGDGDFDEDDDAAESMAWDFTRRSVFAVLAAGSLGLQLNIWGVENTDKIRDAARRYVPGLTADPSSPASAASRLAAARSRLTGAPAPEAPPPPPPVTVAPALAAALVVAPAATAVGDLGLVTAAELAAAEAARATRARGLFPSSLPANDAELAAAALSGDVGALNFVLYVRYATLADLIPDTADRQALAAAVGSRLLAEPATGAPSGPPPSAADAAGWLAGLRLLLAGLIAAGYCDAAEVDDSAFDATGLWTDERREALSVTLRGVAVLPSSQLVAEEGGGALGTAAATEVLVAYLAGVGVHADAFSFFLDEAYRRDPRDYKPTSVVTQLDVSYGGGA